MSNHEKMPLPVEVWLWRVKDVPDRWRASTCNPSGGFRYKVGWTIGPYKIVPGMMSLDELSENLFYISEVDNSGVWETSGGAPANPLSHAVYPTALEAQWAATCLAKEDKP